MTNQLRQRILKGITAQIFGCSSIAYAGFELQSYLKSDIYHGELPDNIRMSIYLFSVVAIVLVTKWTMQKPARDWQKERDERVTRKGIRAAQSKPKE